MKQEVGLDNYEGRTWRGFHHHAALCAAAHAFLALRRALFPPEERAMDAAAGPTAPSADSDCQARVLSPLSQKNQLAVAAVWAVADMKTGAQNAIR